MAAQEPPKDLELCPKCFEMVSRSSPACLEPDCPMLDRTGQSGSDAAVYPELARANLKRMRGDYEEARSICLSILKRYPGNLTAHTLLGDIHAENGDLAHAAEWYEMALEIAPDSGPDRNKLAQVRERLAEREMATTAKQLGLPAAKPRVAWFAWSTVAFVAIVGIGGFLLGDFLRSQRTGASVVRTPITVQGSLPPQTDTVPPTVETPPPGADEPPVADASGHPRPKQDADALNTIQSKCVDGSTVTEVAKDLRTSVLTVTFTIHGEQEPRVAASRLAASVLDNFQESPMVTVRGVRDGSIVYVADANRSELAEARNRLPAESPEGVIDPGSFLSNEWVATSPTPPPARSANSE